MFRMAILPLLALAAVPAAAAAAAAALEAQLGPDLEPSATSGLPEPLRVRMALHAGAVDQGQGGD